MAIIIAMTACQETYPGLSFDMSGDDIREEQGLKDSIATKEEFKVISVALSDPSYHTISASQSRALGAFDFSRYDSIHRAVWDSAVFNVYAFHDTLNIDYSVNHQQDTVSCLLDNIPMRMPDPAAKILSYIIDEEHDGKHYWSNKDNKRPYKFWAYYIDDAKINNEARTKDDIKLDIEIDGSQDILCGVAKLTTEQRNTISLSQDRKELLSTLYSTFSARNDIFPVIDVRHQLARFKFKCFPGESDSEGIVIDSIKVLAQNQATMTVVSRFEENLGCTFGENKEWLKLQDSDNYPEFKEFKYVLKWDEEDENRKVFERTHIDIGESLLIPPTDTLMIQIFAKKFLPEQGDFVDLYKDHNVSFVVNEETFKAGYQYDIRMVLYSIKEFSVSAVLTGWAEGGKIDTNPEDDNFVSY